MCYGHLPTFPGSVSLNAWRAGFFGVLPGFGSCREVHHVSPRFLFEMYELGIVRVRRG